MWTVGNVDEVRNQLLEEWRQLPTEYLMLIDRCARIPKEVATATITPLTRTLKPALDELTSYNERNPDSHPSRARHTNLTACCERRGRFARLSLVNS